MYICYSIDKKGHHDEWVQFFQNFIGAKVADTTFKKVIYLFSKHKLLFLEGDFTHLVYIPFILIRGVFGWKSFIFTIRTEYLLKKGLKYSLKRMLFKSVKLPNSTKIISIQKNTPHKELDIYIDHYIYDIQFWDLSYLPKNKKRPHELSNNLKLSKKTLSFLGNFNDRKGRKHLLHYISSYNNLQYFIIIAGKVKKEDKQLISNHKDVFVIDRYVDREEMFWLYNNSDIIYCFYEKDQRPSGIFGRAVQFGNFVLVKKGGFLEQCYFNYNKLISLHDLSELNNLNISKLNSVPNNNIFDDSHVLKNILL